MVINPFTNFLPEIAETETGLPKPCTVDLKTLGKLRQPNILDKLVPFCNFTTDKISPVILLIGDDYSIDSDSLLRWVQGNKDRPIIGAYFTEDKLNAKLVMFLESIGITTTSDIDELLNRLVVQACGSYLNVLRNYRKYLHKDCVQLFALLPESLISGSVENKCKMLCNLIYILTQNKTLITFELLVSTDAYACDDVDTLITFVERLGK